MVPLIEKRTEALLSGRVREMWIERYRKYSLVYQTNLYNTSLTIISILGSSSDGV